MRTKSVFVGALSAFVLLVLSGCAKLAGLEDSQLDPTGAGGADASSHGGLAGAGLGGNSANGGRDGGSADTSYGGNSADAGLGGSSASAGASTDSGGRADAGCAGLICGGACVPNDVHNCGACGHDCTKLPNVGGPVTCANGKCSFPASSCASGWGHCTANPDDGCETDLSKQDNCGRCGNACSGATPVCAMSGGTSSCASGCSATAPTRCGSSCVDTTQNPTNCGMCGHACTTSVLHAQPTCKNSECTFTCNNTYTPCGGACVDEMNDNNNCGGCGSAFACTGGKTCQNGHCSCPAGTLDCLTSCEMPSLSNHCGTACSTPCPAPPMGGTEFCSGSACASTCNGLTNCSGICVDTTKDTNNCGTCGTVCAQRTQNALGIDCKSSSCDYSMCAIFPGATSYAAYLDCDGKRSNGCESKPNSDTSCGACPSACEAGQWCNLSDVTVGNCLAVPGGTHCVSGGAFAFHCQGGG